MTRDAQCECGLFRVHVEADPVVNGICSCLNCQRRSGSIFGTVAYFPQEKVHIVSGNYKTFVRRGDSGGNLRQHFCPECGTTLIVDAENMAGMRGVFVGCFADPSFPAPLLATYDRTRHPWVSLPPGLPAL